MLPIPSRILFAMVLAASPLDACKPKAAPKAPPPKTAPLPAATTFAGVHVFEGASPAPAPCTITLSADSTPDHPEAHPASSGPGCTVAFPILVPLARWEVVGAATIRFTDKDGYALGDFTKDVSGVLKGTGEDDGKPYTLTPMAVWMKAGTSPAATTDAP